VSHCVLPSFTCITRPSLRVRGSVSLSIFMQQMFFFFCISLRSGVLCSLCLFSRVQMWLQRLHAAGQLHLFSCVETAAHTLHTHHHVNMTGSKLVTGLTGFKLNLSDSSDLTYEMFLLTLVTSSATVIKPRLNEHWPWTEPLTQPVQTVSAAFRDKTNHETIQLYQTVSSVLIMCCVYIQSLI